ncbi:amidohydrolase family protein [Hwanghaeella sp.]|uniref:amidohydrolase family protein n=1 Tax=Hwanghaeella sp. TaxID=2605943 RepID=UPI003CCB945F
MTVIDYGATPPVAEARMPTQSHLSNYRRVYAKAEAESGRHDETRTLDDFFADCDSAGVVRTVIKARDVETTFGGKIRNEDIAALCRSYPDRFIGFAGVDPNKGMEAVREFEFAVRELGLRGLNLQCFENRLPIDDRRIYLLYAKCVELNVPVNIHTGINFSLESSPEYGRPEMLDRVLCDFPELRVCASPPGWPWVLELLSVAWRHPNLWIGVVAVRPRILAKENSGYGPLLQYGSTVLQDRIIWGSAHPMMPIARTVDEVRSLPLEEDVQQKWLKENACSFLNLADV